MAGHPFFPCVKVEIIVNGRPATEYPDPDNVEVKHQNSDVANWQELRTASFYLQSLDNQTFAIKLSVEPPFKMVNITKLGFHIYVDGEPVWHSVCPRPDYKRAGRWEDLIKDVKTGKGGKCLERDFRFAKIETNSINMETSKLKRMALRFQYKGLIEIRVFEEDFGKKGGPTVGEGSVNKFIKGNQTEIPEQAMKGQAKSHGTALANAHKTNRGRVYRTKKKQGEDFPMIIFRLMYRSEEALKTLHILSRTPSPSPSPSRSPSPSPSPPPSLDENNMTAAQRRVMEAELEASRLRQEEEIRERFRAQNEATRLARGARHHKPRGPKGIKREQWEGHGVGGGVGQTRKRCKGEQAEVVDLTGESDGEVQPATPALDLASGDLFVPDEERPRAK